MSDEPEATPEPVPVDATLITVRHPNGGEALVPRMALSQMSPEWEEVDDDGAETEENGDFTDGDDQAEDDDMAAPDRAEEDED